MITIMEDKIVDLVKERLDFVLKNPLLLRSVFNMPQDRIDYLVSSLKAKRIRVQKMYPLEVAQMPCITVGISGENESPSGIGDQIIDKEPHLENKISFEEDFIVDGDCRINFKDVDGIVDTIDKVSCNGIDYKEDIEIIDDYTIEIQLLKKGDVVTVGGLLQKDLNADIEVLYSSSYAIEVWTENADLTVMLYHLLKYILLSSRQYLLDIGMNKQRLTGGDLKPVPSFFPSFIYRRGITLESQVFVSVPEYKANLVTDVSVT